MKNNTNADVEYQVGDYVVYGDNGICKIVDFREEDFAGLDAGLYYVLETVYSRTTIFLPVNSDTLVGKLKPILSEDEINSLIDETEDVEQGWICDYKKRAEHFTTLLNSGKRSEILWIIRALTLHKSEVEEQNKRFYISDKNLLAAAEKIIIEEFAFVLGLDKSEVIPYIRKRLKKKGTLNTQGASG